MSNKLNAESLGGVGSSELLACPFCAWKFPEIQEVNLGMFRKDIHYRVECGMCGIQQRYLNKDKAIAIALWNSRQANSQAQRLEAK